MTLLLKHATQQREHILILLKHLQALITGREVHQRHHDKLH